MDLVDVVIGIDPHKHSSTTAALDRSGRLLQVARFPASRDGYRALRQWAARWPARSFAVEGASGLADRWPSSCWATARPSWTSQPSWLLGSDCCHRATTARPTPTTRSPRPEPRCRPTSCSQSRSKTTARCYGCSLNAATNWSPNAPGPSTGSTCCSPTSSPPAAAQLTAGRAAQLLRRVRTSSATTGARRVRRELASDLVRDVRRLDRQLADLQRRITRVVKQAPTTLPELFGVRSVLTAKLLGEVGDVGRFATKAQFASYTGTAPIEASSGEVVRHRLSRAGNRQLNHALHLMAICQISHDTAGRSYYQRKRAEGKSSKEALRCLKRRLSDVVYQRMLADQRHAQTPAP